MSDYIVSARKYRPQTFDTVVGQEHITTTLKNAIRQKHLAHAYLFCGPRGVGKTTCARILARTINCENPTPDTEACGVCATCQSFKNNTSFNIFELDAASNNSVDDIRELVAQVRFAPQQGQYKIYIIDEVHMLSASAFNAFLKTLEEPPPYAIFILATTEKHKILPTILSRCQIFDFRRITTQDTVNHLQSIAIKEGMLAQEAALHVIAQKSEGCMRDSLSMLDRIASFTGGQITYAGTMEHLAQLDADFYFGLADHLLSQDVSNTLLQLDEVMARGFEGDVIIAGLAEHFRNLLLCKDPRTLKLLDVPAVHRATFLEKANQTPPSYILSALQVINDSELNYKNATNKRLHTEMCLIRLCFLLQAVQGGTVAPKNGEGRVAQAAATAPPAMQQPQPERPASVQQQPPVPLPSVQPAAVPEPPQQREPAAPQKQPEMVEQRQPQPTAAAQPSTLSPGVSTAAPSGRRVGKDMMAGLDALMASKASAKDVKTALEAAEVQSLFEAFREMTREANRSTHHAYLSMMKAEQGEPEEIIIVSPLEMADAYAREMRNEMIDFFRSRTPVMVRVTTTVREDPALKAEQEKGAVLSKSEIFELLARKNPHLLQLKEALGLQIEF